MIESDTGGAPRRLHPSNAKTLYDDLKLPDGRTIGEVNDAELTPLLIGLGIPGCAHENGRSRNVECYAAHLQSIHEAAGKAAVTEWLRKAGS